MRKKRKRLERKKKRKKRLQPPFPSHLLDLRQVLFHGREHLSHGPFDEDVADL